MWYLRAVFGLCRKRANGAASRHVLANASAADGVVVAFASSSPGEQQQQQQPQPICIVKEATKATRSRWRIERNSEKCAMRALQVCAVCVQHLKTTYIQHVIYRGNTNPMKCLFGVHSECAKRTAELIERDMSEIWTERDYREFVVRCVVRTRIWVWFKREILISSTTGQNDLINHYRMAIPDRHTEASIISVVLVPLFLHYWSRYAIVARQIIKIVCRCCWCSNCFITFDIVSVFRPQDGSNLSN